MTQEIASHWRRASLAVVPMAQVNVGSFPSNALAAARFWNTLGVENGFAIIFSNRLLYLVSNTVVSQHADVVLRCHDTEVVLGKGLLYNDHGHECCLFCFIVINSCHGHWTIHKRPWYSCPRAAPAKLVRLAGSVLLGVNLRVAGVSFGLGVSGIQDN
jgi:hypothetical protein